MRKILGKANEVGGKSQERDMKERDKNNEEEYKREMKLRTGNRKRQRV